MALLVGLRPGEKREVRQLVAVYPARLAPIVPIIRRWGGDHLHRGPEAMTLHVQNSLLYAFSIAPGKQGHFPRQKGFRPLCTPILITHSYSGLFHFLIPHCLRQLAKVWCEWWKVQPQAAPSTTHTINGWAALGGPLIAS
jgi:hypothetical protein